ncbi:MAG: hypothetical protein ACJ8LV_13165 [Chthoniobacterales bacterium]
MRYERGGIAHTFNILVAKLAKNDAKPKQFGLAWEVRSRITRHLLMDYETAGSTIV